VRSHHSRGALALSQPLSEKDILDTDPVRNIPKDRVLD